MAYNHFDDRNSFGGNQDNQTIGVAILIAILTPIIVLPVGFLSGFFELGGAIFGSLLTVIVAPALHIWAIKGSSRCDGIGKYFAIPLNVVALLLELYLGFNLVYLVFNPLKWAAF